MGLAETASLLLILSMPGQWKAPPSPTLGKAVDAYDALQKRLAKAKSVQAVLEVHSLGETTRYSFRFLRKNYARILSKTSAIFQTGDSYYDYNPLDNEFWVKPAPDEGLPRGASFTLGGVVGFESLAFPHEPKLEPVSITTGTWQGIATQSIELRNPRDAGLSATLHLDAKTKLPAGWVFRLRTFKSWGRVHDLKLDVAMTPSQFAWRPPSGAKKIEIG